MTCVKMLITNYEIYEMYNIVSSYECKWVIKKLLVKLNNCHVTG